MGHLFLEYNLHLNFKGDNALSNFAMHSTHILMSGVEQGVKQTMSLAKLINPIKWVNMVTKPFMEFMEWFKLLDVERSLFIYLY